MNNNLHRFIIKHLVILILIFKYFLRTFLGIYQHVQKIPIEDSSHFQIVNKIVHRTKKGRKRGVHRVCRVSP